MPTDEPRPARRLRRVLLSSLVAFACLGGGVATAQQVSTDTEPESATETSATTEQQTTAPETSTTVPEPEPAPEPSDVEQDDASAEDTTEDAEQDDSQTTAQRVDRGLRLRLERANPKEAIFAAKREVAFSYMVRGSNSADLRIQAVRKSDRKVIEGWSKENVKGGEVDRVRWNGTKRKGGAAKANKYFFRVLHNAEPVFRKDAKGQRIFNLRHHKFPVRGRHSYGDGFGAGRGHNGVDVFARCGTKMVAARAGKVQYRGYQSSAGNYIVIDGRGTRRDFVYMHLKRPAEVGEGRRVRAGQRIGKVGETGNASGCHLHFELWSGPGWYEGGKPSRRVKGIVKGWDRYS